MIVQDEKSIVSDKHYRDSLFIQSFNLNNLKDQLNTMSGSWLGYARDISKKIDKKLT